MLAKRLGTILLFMLSFLICSTLTGKEQSSCVSFIFTTKEQFRSQVASSLYQLSVELDKRTSIDLCMNPTYIKNIGPDTVKQPLLFIIRRIPTDREINFLIRYITAGGMIYYEGFSDNRDSWLSRLAGLGEFRPIDAEFVLFKTFYLLDTLYSENGPLTKTEGLFYGKRLSLIYLRSPLLRSLETDFTGGFVNPVAGDQRRTREMIIRSLINIVMYSLCLNYKDDAVHIPYILKRRR